MIALAEIYVRLITYKLQKGVYKKSYSTYPCEFRSADHFTPHALRSLLTLSFSKSQSESCFLYTDCIELHHSQMELHTIGLFVQVQFL